MSSKTIDIYLKGKDDASHTQLNAFFEDLKNHKYDDLLNNNIKLIHSMIHLNKNEENSREDLIEKIEHYIGSEMTVTNDNGVIHVYLDTATSFDEEGLHEQLLSMSLEDLEMEIYNSQSGMTYYFQNTNMYDEEEYDETDWKWVEAPMPCLYWDDEILVFSGQMHECSTEEMIKRSQALESVVENDVTEDTTRLIVGDNPEQSILKKANKYEIEIIKEEAFMKALKEEEDE